MDLVCLLMDLSLLSSQTWKSEGFFALYKGFWPNWLRLGPWNIIVSFGVLLGGPGYGQAGENRAVEGNAEQTPWWGTSVFPAAARSRFHCPWADISWFKCQKMPLVVSAASSSSVGGQRRDFSVAARGVPVERVLGSRRSLWPELLEVLRFLDRLLFRGGSLGKVLLLCGGC